MGPPLTGAGILLTNRVQIKYTQKCRLLLVSGSIIVHLDVSKLGARLLEFYILTTYKDISGWLVPFDSMRSWWLHSAAPLGNQAT